MLLNQELHVELDFSSFEFLFFSILCLIFAIAITSVKIEFLANETILTLHKAERKFVYFSCDFKIPTWLLENDLSALKIKFSFLRF